MDFFVTPVSLERPGSFLPGPKVTHAYDDRRQERQMESGVPNAELVIFRAIERCGNMKSFRLLYFRDSVLEATEEVCVRNVLEAVQKAAGLPAHVRVEIWSDNERVAIIGPSLCH